MFCIILFVWVYFAVPETKGVRIEEMDKIFGGNQGEADMQRIRDIRSRLGIHQEASGESMSMEKDLGEKHLESTAIHEERA